MTYAPLAAILVVLFTGAAVTLTVLFRSLRNGEFRNVKSGAYAIFDDDEPVGEPQDQILNRSDAHRPGGSSS